jgi:hypothetical protein
MTNWREKKQRRPIIKRELPTFASNSAVFGVSHSRPRSQMAPNGNILPQVLKPRWKGQRWFDLNGMIELVTATAKLCLMMFIACMKTNVERAWWYTIWSANSSVIHTTLVKLNNTSKTEPMTTFTMYFGKWSRQVERNLGPIGKDHRRICSSRCFC